MHQPFSRIFVTSALLCKEQETICVHCECELTGSFVILKWPKCMQLYEWCKYNDALNVVRVCAVFLTKT